MKGRISVLLSACIVLLTGALCPAEIRTVIEHNDNDHATAQFKFEKIPPPSRNDAATNAAFAIVAGQRDGGGGDVDRLHDGKMPVWEDQPEENFVFATGEGGRIQVDLGSAIDIAQVNTYSWHPRDRGPQVYKLYAADGAAGDFNPKPGNGLDPLTCGWKQITSIDTRPKTGDAGGQYGVSISDSSGSIGHYRYLLFDISRTENFDNWGNTFYSEIDVIQRGAPPGESAVSQTAVARRDPPGDPMDWTPPSSPPALRERIDPAEYAPLARAVIGKVDIPSLRAPGRPLDGMLVTEIIPASPAARLGLHVGDILMTVDGIPLGSRGDDQDMNATRTGNRQRLTYWSPARGEKTVIIQPGRIGVQTYSGWRPLDSYVRSSERNGPWDDDMLVAAGSFLADPDLAETALFHAGQAGYHGLLLVPLAAQIAFGQCRFDDALAWGWPVWSKGGRLSEDSLRVYNDSALLSFRLEQSLDLVHRYGRVLGTEDDIAWLAAAYRRMPKSNLRNPLSELGNVHRKRFAKFDAFAPQEPGDDARSSDWAASVLNAPQALPLNVPSGHYQRIVLGPAAANVALAVHFDVHETDQLETGFAHCICFGLYDLTRAQPQGPMPPDELMVRLLTDGPGIISPFGRRELHFQRLRPGQASPHLQGTMRIIILHNRCEVTLDDGRRIFYGPVVSNEAQRKYGFFIQAIGVTGRVLPPIWESLEDPRTGAGKN